MNGWLLIEIGCAECRMGWGPPPLARILSVHVSLDEAKAAGAAHWRDSSRWEPHPQGGEYLGTGYGDLWAAPVSAFTGPRIDVDWPDD